MLGHRLSQDDEMAPNGHPNLGRSCDGCKRAASMRIISIRNMVQQGQHTAHANLSNADHSATAKPDHKSIKSESYRQDVLKMQEPIPLKSNSSSQTQEQMPHV